MDIDWNAALLDQLEWHWHHQLRPRLDGLTDTEYFWEPAPGCWNVRRRGESTAPIAAGSGEYTIDFAMPEPEPAPITTIAWRLGHVIVGVLGIRNANHFGAEHVEHGLLVTRSGVGEPCQGMQCADPHLIGLVAQ